MKHAFLALLAEGQTHGYELKQALDERLDEIVPPMNAGQVYTTLARLERDGLVVGEEIEGDGRGKRVYALTDAGRAELQAWLATPAAGPRLKDDFALKLVFAGLSGLADARGLVERQRRECLQSLRDLETRRRDGNGGLAAELLIEGAMFHLEADLRWLELIETRIENPGGTHGNRP